MIWVCFFFDCKSTILKCRMKIKISVETIILAADSKAKHIPCRYNFGNQNVKFTRIYNIYIMQAYILMCYSMYMKHNVYSTVLAYIIYTYFYMNNFHFLLFAWNNFIYVIITQHKTTNAYHNVHCAHKCVIICKKWTIYSHIYV